MDMSAIVASAMLLQCFFSRPADGTVATNDVPVIKVPLPVEMAQSMIAKQPPISRLRFTGENEPAREWVIGNAGDRSASVQLLRIALSEAPLSPSEYGARFGTATLTDEGAYRFNNKMIGYCKLLPAAAAQ